MRAVSVIAASCCVMVLWAAAALGDTLAPVGMRRLEFPDRDRRLLLTVFYPAETTGEADLFTMPFFVGLELHRDAALRMPATRHPLVTPPDPNAEFAAKHIPHATLAILPGLADHEIFVNECNKEGRDEFPEACIDAEGVDRAALHRTIGEAAVGFFGTALRTSP